MKKQLKIISSTHARELNKLGETPKYAGERMKSLWQEAESNLKEYQIEETPIDNLLKAIEDKVGGKIINVNSDFKIGSTHICECNDETLTAIIL